MSKVGRAAFAASRARVEVITADKTINKNESGELYAVDIGANLAITLPADAQDGTRYKFMIIDDAAHYLTITTGTANTQPFQGAVLHIDTNSPDDASGTQNVAQPVKADGDTSGADDQLKLNTPAQGSYVICVYSSSLSRWLVEGVVMDNTAPTFS